MPASPAPAGSISSSVPPPAATPGARLMSLDALRGFSMFWILGPEGAAMALSAWIDSPATLTAGSLLAHSEWEGFTFFDLIFPLFVFITGVSVVFSLEKSLARDGQLATIKRILFRTLLLFAFGILYNGGLSNPWPDVRIAGVLQRIALAYGATSLLVCFVGTRARAIVAIAILMVYWALFAVVPIRDVTLDRESLSARLGKAEPTGTEVRALYDATTKTVTNTYEPGYNLANHTDYLYLPGFKWRKYWDPEGLLGILPTISTCLIGVLAGTWLRRRDRSDQAKLRGLLIAGVASLAAGWTWGLAFPVIKQLWTSSFVLVASGWSLLLLGLFYSLIDMRRWQTWCRPFVWIGMNPITLYLATSLVDFHRIARFLAGGSIPDYLDEAFGKGAGRFFLSLVVCALLLAVARFLYRRQIYLRV